MSTPCIPNPTGVFHLRALDENAAYEFTDADDGSTFVRTGKELSDGLPPTLDARTAKVYFYKKL